jgi:NADH-quinone oxidoreductase subunit L
MDEHTRSHLHETPWVVTLPLILLAIPSVVIGWLFVDTMAFGNFFGDAIHISAAHPAMAELSEAFHGPFTMVLHGLMTAPFWLALAGVVTAYLLYMKWTNVPGLLLKWLRPLHTLLVEKYYFDQIFAGLFGGGSRLLGNGLWKGGDMAVIDGFMVNGSGRSVVWLSSVVRKIQTGMLFHYAFVMILGLLSLFALFVVKWQ